MALLSSKAPSFLILFIIFCSFLPSFVFATQQCIHNHFSALLHLKNGFDFEDYSLSALSSWNSNNTDCCSWEGIRCDGATDHVISLDLSGLHVSGWIDFESLFRLRSLQRLNLALNDFHPSPIPSGFDQLTSLTHLNLSRLSFYGQIPLEISLLTRLVSLDLSHNYYYNRSVFLRVKLEISSIRALLQNMSTLRELFIDGVNISAPGSERGQALFSSIPHLRRLSLRNCGLSGSVFSSLSQLHFLSKLDLSYNNLSSAVPSFPGSLRRLSLRNCGLSGSVFSSLSQLHFLSELDLSYNNLSSAVPSFPGSLRKLSLQNCGLSGSGFSSLSQLHFLSELDLSFNNLSSAVPSFTGSLRKLRLRRCSLSGSIHSSFSQLHFLSELDLSSNNLSFAMPNFTRSLRKLSLQGCDFSGSTHSSFSQLHFLSELDLSYSNLSSTMPSFTGSLSKLILRRCNLSGPIHSSLSELRFLSELELGGNNLSGSLPSFLGNLSKLQYLDLQSNSFSGLIPASLFSLPSLKWLNLRDNKIGGRLDDIHNASSTQLEYIFLDHNNFQGMMPSFIFKLMKLRSIFLSFNNLSGALELGLFQNLKNLSSLDLSDNNLLIEDIGGNFTFSSFPQIRFLSLRSCNITKFPNLLQNQEKMRSLDLSSNKIAGGIPKWIWKVGNGTLYYLNLSRNALQRIETLFPHVLLSDWVVIDLSSNMLQGSLPIPPPITFFFSLSNNMLSGEIPISICNTTSLAVLDLSRNQLSGWIPSCLGEISNTLNVLNLQGNVFNGTLLQTFKEGCNLQTLDLSENQLEGEVPRSLANCKMLEVFNLGNNQITDTFPSWVEALSQLRIFVLKSNKFYGPITLPQTNQSFPMLQIFDLSSNSFTGGLPSNIFQSWKAMTEEDQSQSEFLHRTTILVGNVIHSAYYQDTVTIMIKGHERELTKILTIFTAIDLSNNSFQGDIPESIGVLKLLRQLNMSHNGFTGQIPTSLENLTVLGSLDLSRNNISGEIPQQLTKLTSLAVLNLSQNHLTGSIPQSKQFLTFTNQSFQGNLELCGPPLSRKCIAPQPIMPTFEVVTSELDWKFMWIGFGVGYGAGMGAFFWTLALWTKGMKVYKKFIDSMVLLIFSSAIFHPRRR